MRRIIVAATGAALAAMFLTGCGAASAPTAIADTQTSGVSPRATHATPTSQASPSETAVSPEPPVPTEDSPPGDIPDDVAFVPFHTKGGVSISVPEGWARTTAPASVTFTDKLNTVVVSWEPGIAPTLASAKTNDVPALAGQERAFTLVDVSETTLPAGPAVVISYQANSEPNAVTGKQYRLDVLRYELFHAGQRVTLTLLSPVGADNVDPWRVVTESLAWR